MSTVEISLVRHGESVSNARGLWQGHGDSPLNDRGRTQAEALSRVLADERYDVVVSSDLSRAADTARATAGADIVFDAAWREIDVGEWEGLTMEQVVERFPEQIEALKARRIFAVGGGESWPEVFARADGALEALRQRLSGGGSAIVFTHGGIIAAIMAGLLGARDRFPWPLGRMRNTGRTTIRFEGDRVSLIRHNDDAHVPGSHRKSYVPRSDQVVLRLVADEDLDKPRDPAGLDFNSAIEVARARGTGEVMSVYGQPDEIASVVQDAISASPKDFRFLAPPPRSTTELLVSPNHTMILDYGLR